MKDETQKKQEEYLNNLLNNNTTEVKKEKFKTEEPVVDLTYGASNIEYKYIDINILPCGRYYKKGTKIGIRAAKVSEIQAYSMVDDNNFVDITEKMNELLSRNVKYIHPDNSVGDYKFIKDADRIFLIFMIRELTFQGGNTLTKEVECPHCNKEFKIPFRATNGQYEPATFELHEANESIEKFYQANLNCYQLVLNNVSYHLAPPTIGIQEDFFAEIKRNVQDEKKPDVAFLKIVPFLLYDRNTITSDGIKAKIKEFKQMEDLILFTGLNKLISNMTVGIKGLKMNCPECNEEVHSDLTFPDGASTLFEIPDIFDKFK